MPFRFEDFKTPAGKPCLRLHVSGLIELADAEHYAAALRPGARYHRMLTLSLVARGTEFSAAARKRFLQIGDDAGPLASVVTSALVRAGLNLILRMTNLREIGTYRMFASEPEALAWLDAQPLPPTTK